MKTRKPFSTISYNTSEFLESKISELIAQGVLDFACYITHLPEEDEEKAHKHVYFMPSGDCDTKALKTCFEEIDPNNSKPLGCTIFVSSKFDDWYLYAVHDNAYLASKGQKRKYHYTYDQVRNTDEIFFRELVNCIDRSKFIGTERVINAVKDGIDFEKLVTLGAVPIQLINQYKLAYECVSSTFRNGRETHTPKQSAKPRPVLVDEESGEVVATASNGGRDRRKSRSAAQVSFYD